MRSRPNTSRPSTNPGPGNYNLRSEKSLEVHSYKFRWEIRDKTITRASLSKPGPGQYSTNDPNVKSAPKFSFGKELRADRGRPTTPGPGQYQSKIYIGRSV